MNNKKSLYIKPWLMKIIISPLLVLFFSLSLFAQGDGPRNLLWGPKGVTAFIPKWMSLDQNITPGNFLVKNADFKIDVFPMTLVHNFGLGGHFAQLMFSAVPGSANGSISISQPGFPAAPNLSADGFADGFVGFKFGLINTPALNVIEFAKHKQKFSMFLYTRWWYSGSYDKKKPLNLGSNRSTYEIGFPMNVQLSKRPKRPTWLEMYPAIHLYGENNDPTLVTMASTTQQVSLFSMENHLTHNLTDKLWIGGDLRYQYGGALKVDDVKQDNTINVLGGGFVAGYQLLPMLGISAGYGGIISGDNGAKSNMFRLTAVLSYVNMKKLKKQAAPVAVVTTPEVPKVVDSDGDGIADANDKCPNQAGTAKYGGCPIPDSDGDGINDEQDKCPNTPGLAKYGGCPIPDSDGDGINDEQDKCPNTAGLPKYGGCPIPDTDGDGINDEQDRCPKLAGTAENLGCPEMVYYYKRAESTLSADDKVNLDKVVAFMNNNPDLNIIVEGHTSTLGTDAYNMTLSKKRADNSVKYLVSKGIDPGRMKAEGFGEQYPIGDNSKEEGRAQSRRVVIKISQ